MARTAAAETAGTADAVPDPPTFHLVVERPRRPGPLAPYRFVLAIAFATVIAGRPLWDAAETGVDLEPALLRAAGAAALMWFLSGQINRILATAGDHGPTSGSGGG